MPTSNESAEDAGRRAELLRIGHKTFESRDGNKANDQAMRFAEAEVLAHPRRELINIANSMSKYAKDQRSRHHVTVWYRY